MLSNQFLNTYLQKVDKIEVEQLKTTFIQLKNDYTSFYTVMNVLDMSIFLLDGEGKILFLNQKAKQDFYVHNNMVNDSIADIVRIEDFAVSFHKWVQSSKMLIREELVDDKSVKSIWGIDFYNLTLEQSFLKKEHKISYILVFRDITTDKKLQERKNLQKSLSSMQHLAASLAHEIKNPLTSIKLYIEILEKLTQKEVQDKQEINHSLSVIKDEVERLSGITTDFLTNIRPLSLNITKIHPEELFLSLRELIQPILIENHIHLTIRVEENIPNIAGDTTYVRMIMLNLLKNAIESFETLENNRKDLHKEIIVKLEENSPFIQITIEDNGVGIAKEYLEKIFDPYFTTKKTGTGIGLSLVQKVIAEHKGDIVITSKKNKGTKVIILLPIYKGIIHKFLSQKV